MTRADTYTGGKYLEQHPTWHQEDSPWKARQISTLLRRNGIAPASICEVGCGAGEILKRLADEMGADVSFVGYEISPQAFEICRRKEQQNLRFELADLLQQPESTFFDVAMAIDVFEHVEDFYGFLRRFRPRATHKVFHIPLDLSVQAILRASPIRAARANDGHIHYFYKDTALESLKDTGYEIVDWFYTSSSLELPSTQLSRRVMKMPRKILYSINQDFAVRLLGGFSLMVLAR